MRIIPWNIERGGGREELLAEAIVRHGADVAVLMEYFPDRSAPLVNLSPVRASVGPTLPSPRTRRPGS